MKPRMMSKSAMDHLFDHVLDGHAKTYEGINNLKDMQIIDERDYIDLLKKNTERLISRIHEFKIIHKIVCIIFTMMFSYLQITGEDLEMRRASRGRTRKKSRSEITM